MSRLNTVIYDSAFSANVRVDRKEEPYGILYLITDSSLDMKTGVAKESAEVQVFFAKKGDFDSTGEEKDIIIEDCMDISKEFIGRLLDERSLYVESDTINMKTTWGKFDAFLIGVVVRLRVRERQGHCLEYEKIIEDDENQQENES